MYAEFIKELLKKLSQELLKSAFMSRCIVALATLNEIKLHINLLHFKLLRKFGCEDERLNILYLKIATGLYQCMSAG